MCGLQPGMAGDWPGCDPEGSFHVILLGYIMAVKKTAEKGSFFLSPKLGTDEILFTTPLGMKTLELEE